MKVFTCLFMIYPIWHNVKPNPSIIIIKVVKRSSIIFIYPVLNIPTSASKNYAASIKIFINACNLMQHDASVLNLIFQCGAALLDHRV